jgi:ferredoxin
MNLLRSIFGRRQFLFAFISSVPALAFGRAANAFDLLFKSGVARASQKTVAGEKKALKGIVVYYSATGNTARIANGLYQGMRSVIACDVAPIKKVKPGDMSGYDVLAIAGPNWYMRVPTNLLIFTHDMPLMDGKLCIIFGTHGAQPIGQYWSLSRNIIKKGMTIIGWNDWYGTDIMSPFEAQPDGQWGHPDDIDIAEAEAFGKRMAENAIRIHAGEKGLIPKIPSPPKGQQTLWSARQSAKGNITFSTPPPNSIPEFDLTKCVYPRCTQCMGNCPANAIDFSVLASVGSLSSGGSTASPLVLKEACQHCGGLCQRVCIHDAIAYEGEKIKLVVNTKKCTYPKCTICIDECTQGCIDFSKSPPVFHNHCEGEGLCWMICPENAIEVPNMAAIMLKKAWWFKQVLPQFSPQAQAAQAAREAAEYGETVKTSRGAGGFQSKLRPLIRQEEVGVKGKPMYFTSYPRVPIDKKLWPYHIGEG